MKIFTVLLGGLLLAACAHRNTISVSQMQDLSLGMTPNEASMVVGRPNRMSADGNQRSWIYLHDRTPYRLVFTDGRLTFFGSTEADVQRAHELRKALRENNSSITVRELP